VSRSTGLPAVAGARTTPELLAAWAEETPDAVALVHGPTALTYRQLAQLAGRAAVELLGRGVGPGDRVVLIGHNSIEWVVAYLATLRLGAIVCPANNRLNETQFVQQCDLIDSRLVLVDADHADLALASGRAAVALRELARPGEGSDGVIEAPLPDPDADALISFTSGTTGTPKGAVISHAALTLAPAAIAERVRLDRTDSTLVLVPLFHNTGFIDQLGVMLVTGGATHLLRKYRTADAVEELRARPVTYLTAVPSILRLLMLDDAADVVYGPARTVLFGGSPMPASWSAELLDRWPQLELVHGYGLTEFTSGCTTLSPDLIASVGESVGVPLPRVELQICGDDGSPVDPGRVGEVWVKGPTRMSRYWKQPELTAAKLAGEWLRTGDLGYVDARGLLWLTGRIDDVINRGGEKVLPAHVESRVCALPEVAEAVVFGVPDPVLQCRVGVAVLLRAGRDLDTEAARTRLAGALPDYAVPEYWVVLDQIPRTGSGKADRRAVTRAFMKENAHA
jgi:long-chain acyl-CoA synthetase